MTISKLSRRIKTSLINFKQFNIDVDNHVSEHMRVDIMSSNLFVVGEIHGVRENARLYYWLLKEFNFETLALEYPISIKEQLLQFLVNGKIPKHYSLEENSDGRVNIDYLNMLRKAWEEKLFKNIICFDKELSSRTWNERDFSYASQFLSEYSPGNVTLLVTGNLHSQKQKFTSRSEKEKLIPMCYHIKREIGDFPTCRIIYHRGSFYNFGVKRFSRDLPEIKRTYLEKVKKMYYEVHVKRGTKVSVP